MDRTAIFHALMEKVRAHAEAHGGTLELDEPATTEEIDGLAEQIEPEIGTFAFQIPPSYRAFLELWGGATVTGDDFTGDEFRILTLDEVVSDTEDLVHLPAGAEWEDEEGREVEISTSHLVAFATADAEARWCFCTDTPRKDDELPVYYFQRDEPLSARDATTGDWIDDDGAEPDFPDFLAWLRDYVDGFLMITT